VPAKRSFDAILFDLDGTLIDTAPDMVAVLVDLLAHHGRPPIHYDLARSHVSHGSAGLVRLAFPDLDDAERERLRLEFLDRYEAAVCVNSMLFPGLEPLLDILDAAALPWGVVTNKPARMTNPLLRALGLDVRSATIVSGDTIPERKPDPAPLLLASREAAIDPLKTMYIGDAARDIEAGRRAGMFTIAAAYGYIPAEEDPESWQADAVVKNTEELAHLVLKGVNLAS
jgi:2-phosphoglycolate phosphatase